MTTTLEELANGEPLVLEISYKRSQCPVVNGVSDEFEGTVSLEMLAQAASIDGFNNEAFKKNIIKIGSHPSYSRNGMTGTIRGILTAAYMETK